MSATPRGTATPLGDAHGKVTDVQGFVDWLGDAVLYAMEPPLCGFPRVVASTMPDAPRVRFSGGVEYGVETFLYGVSNDNIIAEDREELPGSGWGNTAQQALAEAGYRIV